MNGDYYDVWTVSPPGCDDSTACNYPSTTENCTYPADACTACDGTDLGGQDACGVVVEMVGLVIQKIF